jgi:hypothetical protein
MTASVVGAREHDKQIGPRRGHLLESADEVHRGVARDAEVDQVEPRATQKLRPRARAGGERIAERDQSLSGKHGQSQAHREDSHTSGLSPLSG